MLKTSISKKPNAQNRCFRATIHTDGGLMKIQTIALCLILAGCATTIMEHPTKGPNQFDADLFDCETAAEQRAYNLGSPNNIFMIPGFTQECLEKKYGWHVASQ